MSTSSVRQQATRIRDELICSDAKPSRTKVHSDAIPTELKDLNRWVCWKWFRKNDRWTKKPLRPNGEPASFTNSADHSAYEACLKAFEASKSIDGIGLVLGEGYFGFDLDCCFYKGNLDGQIDAFLMMNPSYTEISPSGTGLKTIFKGEAPKKWDDKQIVLYENKFFTITGDLFDVYSCDIESFANRSDSDAQSRMEQAIEAMERIPIRSEQDGSGRLIKYANRAVRFGLDTADALDAIQRVLDRHPTPKEFSTDEIETRISDAQKKLQKNESSSMAPISALSFLSLLTQNPKLKEPLIDGILRKGETMNIIASPKIGKSFLASNLAWSIASGSPWLGRSTVQGRVAIIDNELHPETLAHRLQEVAGSLFLMDQTDILNRIDVFPLRGKNIDIHQLSRLKDIEHGKYDLVIVDALYRFLPKGTSENDNADMMAVYNVLDSYAAQWGSAVVVVHHSSKGFQGDKNITDVGSGAGAISRAADTHAIVRPHTDPNLAVLEVVTRSFKSPDPISIQFSYPLWSVVSVEAKVKSAADAAKEAKQGQDDEAAQLLLNHIPEGKGMRRARLFELSGTSDKRFTRLIGLLEQKDLIRTRRKTEAGQKRVQVYYFRRRKRESIF